MRIMTILGTRPEFIKSGPVSRAFATRGITEVCVHTGQHYDDSMSRLFFEALGLREPDYNLMVGSGSHGRQTGRMLDSLEQLMLAHPVDAVLVYGDTNSTLAGALTAVKLHVPLVHVEAGLRSFNRNMPEEINRILTDHISSLLFCPTQAAVENLAMEGIRRGVHLVGDVNQDALDYWLVRDGSRQDIASISRSYDYYVATVHRAENVDDPVRLESILRALESLPYPVILPLHPRTANVIDQLDPLPAGSIRYIPPVGFLEMLDLIHGSRAVLTDSGGVQKEAYMLGVPCITLRNETEWVETLHTGWNTLAGTQQEDIIEAALRLTVPATRPPIFGDGHASDLIADIVLDTIPN